MKKILARITKREDQSQVHIATIYVTVLLATVYAIVCVAF